MPDMTPIDVRLRDEGTLVLFYPETDAAKDWIEENVTAEAQWFGGGLVVEHRFAADLAIGMIEAGLVVQVPSAR